jgi:hypothetical protein
MDVSEAQTNQFDGLTLRAWLACAISTDGSVTENGGSEIFTAEEDFKDLIVEIAEQIGLHGSVDRQYTLLDGKKYGGYNVRLIPSAKVYTELFPVRALMMKRKWQRLENWFGDVDFVRQVYAALDEIESIRSTKDLTSRAIYVVYIRQLYSKYPNISEESLSRWLHQGPPKQLHVKQVQRR